MKLFTVCMIIKYNFKLQKFVNIDALPDESDSRDDNQSECSYTTNKSSSSSSIPLDVPYHNLTIPEFSSGVRAALLDGKSAEVWTQMMEELVTYYICKCHIMNPHSTR